MITRPQAWDHINRLITNPNLVKHCLAVEAAMLAYAEHFQVSDQEKELWAVAGLIHDADYEKYPQQHPQVIIQWLRDHQAGEDLINAVAAHGFNFDIPANTLMAKTLRAVDELTGLIIAVALVKDKRLVNVSVESILKKWSKKEFAAGVNREDIEKGAAEINLPLEQHIQIVLKGLQDIALKLGL